MARPRKDHAGPDARQRLIDAYIEIASTSEERITVSSLTKRAHCNRDTFYYHFDNIDDLTLSVVEQLFSPAIPMAIIESIEQRGPLKLDDDIRRGSERAYRLLARRPSLKPLAVERSKVLWTSQLSGGAAHLSLEDEILLDFVISGAMDVLVSCSTRANMPSLEDGMDLIASFVGEETLHRFKRMKEEGHKAHL